MKPTLSLAPNPAKELAKYCEFFPQEAEGLAALRDRLAEVSAADALNRTVRPGHVLSTALVLDHSLTCVLVVRHHATGAWQPPGGHYEGSGTLSASALREAQEETGVSGAKPLKLANGAHLLDVKTIGFPGNPAKGEDAHLHHDYMYLFQAPRDVALVAKEDEVGGVRWAPFAEFRQMENPRFERLMAKVAVVVEALHAAAAPVAAPVNQAVIDEPREPQQGADALSDDDFERLCGGEDEPMEEVIPLTVDDLADLAMFR